VAKYMRTVSPLAALDANREMALATLDREWDGLAAHRDYPMIGWITTQPSAPCAGPS